jgi:hypothetical protein
MLIITNRLAIPKMTLFEATATEPDIRSMGAYGQMLFLN